jgi:nucleotide-binding universal stress UspA family protein
MLKAILVGLDGSAYSRTAVDLGIQWAKRFDALLVGLGVIDEVTISGYEFLRLGPPQSHPRRWDTDLVAAARRKVEQFLERFALRCAEEQVACKILEDVGAPGERIVLEAQRYDLILLGRRTYFRFETEEGIDDTLRRVLKGTPRPVVTVPKGLRPGGPVLVAYDGSLEAARAVQAFQATGLGEGCDVHVLCVDPAFPEAARRAGRAAEFLRFHGARAVAHPLACEGPPAKAILEQVRRLGPCLLVMGAYGQRGWREFLFGSVTGSLLETSPVPLFLYH